MRGLDGDAVERGLGGDERGIELKRGGGGIALVAEGLEARLVLRDGLRARLADDLRPRLGSEREAGARGFLEALAAAAAQVRHVGRQAALEALGVADELLVVQDVEGRAVGVLRLAVAPEPELAQDGRRRGR